MVERRPDYYTQFHCLGSACPDTCCRDWSVVPDGDALADYAAAPSPLGERIAQNLVTDGDGDVCFRLDERGMCALLTPEGLCALQRDWGEEHLCAHCAAYPRFLEEYGCLTESSLAISCPEAARLLRSAPRFTLIETRDGRDDPPFDGVDPAQLAGLEHSRAKVLALLDGARTPIWERLRAMAAYALEAQDCIDAGEYGKMGGAELPSPFQAVHDNRRTYILRLLDLMASLEPLRPDWPRLLKACSAQLAALAEGEYAALCSEHEEKNPRWGRQLTNLACYLVFRHWHKAVNDDLLYGRAAFVCAACSALYHLSLFQPGEELALWTRFSREIEHDEDNLAQLIWALSEPEIWPPSALL